MEPMTAALSVAKIVLPKVASPLAERAKEKIFGDPDEKAFARALLVAFEQMQQGDRQIAAYFDLTIDLFQREAADVLVTLLRRRMPTAVELAMALVSSVHPMADSDTRWGYIDRLWGPCQQFLRTLTDELGNHPAFNDRLPEPTDPLATPRLEYLRWVTQRFRYVETTGISSLARVQLQLSDVYVSITATRRKDLRARLDDQRKAELDEIDEQFRRGLLGGVAREALLDRLGLDSEFADHHHKVDPGGNVDPVRAVGESSRVVLVGDPGGGKTTLLRYLALHHARAVVGDTTSTKVVGTVALTPIFVSAGQFARSAEHLAGLRSYLADPENVPDCPVAADQLTKLLDEDLRQGRCLVLIDGLDEVGTIDQRLPVVEAITRFTSTITEQGNHVVVTSRPSGYDSASLPDSFDHFRMLDMDDSAIERFLTNYLPLALPRDERTDSDVARRSQDSLTKLTAAFTANPGIRRLAANPLLLTALVLVHVSLGELPASRVEAYVAIEKAMTQTWRAGKVPETLRPDPAIVRRWLRRLAVWITEHRPERSASMTELIELLGPDWCEENDVDWPADLLHQAGLLSHPIGRGVHDTVLGIAQHTGLLVERAFERWGFPHLTFQEYFTAVGMLEEGNIADQAATLRCRVHDSRYREVLLLAIGLYFGDNRPDTDKVDFFDAVVFGTGPKAQACGLEPSPHEHLVGRDQLFALRVLADDVRLKRKEVHRILNVAVDELVTKSGRGRYTRYRTELEAALTAMPKGRCAEQLVHVRVNY